MTSNGGTDYTKGVTYTYTTNTSSLGIGEHYFRYVFDDGSGLGPAIYEGSIKPWVTPLTLTNSGYSSSAGTVTFQTTYTDSNNATPQATVYVDNKSYTMTCLSNPCSYSSGTVYQSKAITLSTGKHTFFFIFDDGKTSWADPFAPTVYSLSSSTVGTHSKFVKPDGMITPSHDDDPDTIQGQVNSNDAGDANG